MDNLSAGAAKAPQAAIGGAGLVLGGLFGVLLPLVTLGVELFTGMCREFFDPIPTPVHIAAIALVAVANGLALRDLFGGPGKAPGRTWLAALNAVALGVACFYALWFAFLTPFAVLAILFFGLGLLPLSPLLSLIVAWFLRCRLRRAARPGGAGFPRVWPVFFAAFGVMVALEIPGLAQAWAIRTVAASEPAALRQQALWVLRHAVSEDQLLRTCYPGRDGARDTIQNWLFGPVSVESCRKVFFRATGWSFNQLPPPSQGRGFPGHETTRDTQEWVWDDSLGGEGVGQRLKALYLTESRLDGTIEGDAAVGYLEWTMVFRNDHEFQQREARALVQLPAGAVVSRLTLWINGEEREAAFGGRSQVRQAYQAVVSQRRDPVLVTAKGPDRVLVQCFPVEPKGKEMKIRLGITLPLEPDGESVARFSLPRVIEQNYSPASGLRHALWIESPAELSSAQPAYRAEPPRHARHALHGELSPAEFASYASALVVKREAVHSEFWTPYPLASGSVVTQRFVRQPAPAGPVSIVLDGSGALAPLIPELADELARLPATFAVTLRLAGDTVKVCPASEPPAVAGWLRAQEFVGGQDATVALQDAVSALGAAGGTVLWIHGAQPESWHHPAALEQSVARRAGGARLIALQALSGPNVLLEKLGEAPHLRVLPRTGYFKDDLRRALDCLQNGAVVAERTLRPDREKSGTEVSSHLARLWAAEEVVRMLAGGQQNREAAVKLAVRMQLVTAMSGAVVLETQQQYDAAGLKAVDPNTVPRVSEGGSVLLMAAACMLALLIGARFCGTRASRLPTG